MDDHRDLVSSDRRIFFKWLTRIFLSLWGIGIAGVVTSYLKAPETQRSAGLSVVKAGDAASLKTGEARAVRHGNSPFFVIRTRGGDLLAISGLCTHFSCVLNWNEADQTLVCPCHDGVFSATGDVISGIPSKPLRTFPVEVRRGELLIHL